MSELRIFNRQKTRAIRTPFLRDVSRHLLEKCRGHQEYQLGIHLIDARAMTTLNKSYLNHAGSTDVITFSHQDGAANDSLHGEIFICVDDAIAQAKQFQTTWPSEIVRYLVHGILHLEGHDDLQPAARRVMKVAENKLVKELSHRFDLGKLARMEHERK